MYTGTGKTLLARAVAKQLDANFLKVVSSAIVDKYIGESARLIREMFGMLSSTAECVRMLQYMSNAVQLTPRTTNRA